MPYEYSIDVNEWIQRFPLDEYRDAVDEIDYLSGPFDLAIIEQAWREQRQPEGIPIDVFVFARGEPEHRHVTKIGGMPYRPSDEPWPTCKGPSDPSLAEIVPPAGAPMTFLAQFCFEGSRDITGDLPGDVLLVFTEDDTYETEPHFEWYPLGLSDLVSQSQIPYQTSPFVTCFGHICRLHEPDYPTQRWLDFAATKIGGSPAFIHGDPESPDQFLCQLSSMQPTCERPYPWIDRESPISVDEHFAGDYSEMQARQLCMVDMGNLYLFLDNNGKCTAEFDTY